MDKSRIEPTIFFIEKISFSLKLFSGHFYGQSFIKTVRGPYMGVLRGLKKNHPCATVWHVARIAMLYQTVVQKDGI